MNRDKNVIAPQHLRRGLKRLQEMRNRKLKDVLRLLLLCLLSPIWIPVWGLYRFLLWALPLASFAAKGLLYLTLPIALIGTAGLVYALTEPLWSKGDRPNHTLVETPPDAVPEENWVHKVFHGVDENKKQAVFELWVMSDEFHWKLGSSSTVELNQQKTVSFVEHLKTPGMQARLRASRGLIMVGASSAEGSILQEEKRARERANQLLAWTRQVDSETVHPYFTLDIGQYLVTPLNLTTASQEQRPLIIISIIQAESDVDLKSALYNGIRTLPGLRVRLADYSRFKLEQRS